MTLFLVDGNKSYLNEVYKTYLVTCHWITQKYLLQRLRCPILGIKVCWKFYINLKRWTNYISGIILTLQAGFIKVIRLELLCDTTCICHSMSMWIWGWLFLFFILIIWNSFR